MTRHKIEHALYADEGCDSFPACLTCPLDTCKYDDPTALLRWRNQGRDAQIGEMTAEGFGPKAIAETLGIGERTVARVRRRSQRHDARLDAGEDEEVAGSPSRSAGGQEDRGRPTSRHRAVAERKQ